MTGTINHRRLADLLLVAEADRSPIEPLTDQLAHMTMDDAYRIQDRLIARRRERGECVVGAKLGFTSAAMRESMGIDQPNYGWLTDCMVAGREVSLTPLIHPRIEPEIAFRLARTPVRRGGATSAKEVLAVTLEVMPALEIVDSRFRRYRFRLPDNTADNSSAARVVLGTSVAFGGVQLDRTTVTLERNGVPLETATGAAALGDPARAVAWLVDRLQTTGRSLQAGDVVISGGLTRAVPIGDGDEVTARFEQLGTLSVRAFGAPAEPSDRTDS